MINISKDILNMLGESVVKYWSSENKKDFKYIKIDEIKKGKYTTSNEKRDINNALQYLKRRKYITIKKTENSKLVILTAKGAEQYTKYCNLVGAKRKGHNLTLVVLEIPEKKRELRDFVRRRLQENGFLLSGRGVYLSTHKINNNFKFMIHLFGLEKNIMWGEYKPECTGKIKSN